MQEHKTGIQNIIFRSLIIIAIIFLIIFIIMAISMVLIRGVPNLWQSIQTEEIRFAIKLSFYTSITSTFLCIIFSVPIAYGLARYNFKGKELISAIIDIPMALPPIVSGVALLLLFGTTSFGNFLADNGLKFVFTIKGIILAQFFVNIPYILRILKSTFKDIDPRLEFVSRTLGYNSLQTFFKVTLPLAKNGLIAGLVITWARALGEFGAALMLAGATRMRTETLPISLFLNMSSGDLKLGLAAATMIIFISLVSLLIFEFMGVNNFIISRKKD